MDNTMVKDAVKAILYTVNDDGTVRNIGNELTTALALLYRQHDLTLEQVKEMHERSAPPTGTQASKAWEYISATAEDKFIFLDNITEATQMYDIGK